MPSSNVCWGIEIGAGGIKAIKLEAADGGNVRVADFVSLPHKKVLVVHNMVKKCRLS